MLHEAQEELDHAYEVALLTIVTIRLPAGRVYVSANPFVSGYLLWEASHGKKDCGIIAALLALFRPLCPALWQLSLTAMVVTKNEALNPWWHYLCAITKLMGRSRNRLADVQQIVFQHQLVFCLGVLSRSLAPGRITAKCF